MTLAAAPDVIRTVLAGTRLDPRAGAIRSGRRLLTHGELDRQVHALAARLRAEGLLPGDAMLFSVRPGPDAVVLALAVVAAGGVVVIADPGAGAEVFGARVALARPAWTAAESLLYTLSGRAGWQRPLRALAGRAGLLLPDYGALQVRHLRAGPWLPGLPAGTGSLRRWSAGPDVVPQDDAAGAGSRSPALVVFTSGTTGDPRAVVHSRRSLGAALEAAATAFPIGPGDRVLTDQLMIGLTAVASGACWIVPRIGAHPRDLARRMVRHRATHAFTTPVCWAGVLAERAPSGLPESLRYVLTGGAPAPAALLGRLQQAAPQARVLAVYGATELLPAAVVDARDKVAFDGVGDLVGRPLPGVEVRIDEPAHEVLLRAPQLCEGYLRPDGVAPLGELRTGDAGRLEPAADGLDGAGGVRIVLEGRLKEMMIRGSMNIYPGLYEPGVLAVPGVLECALVGLPDPLTADERIVLALVLDPVLPAEPVLARVREALPAVFDAAALPDEVLAVTALPRSGRAGKLDRAAVADLVRPLLAARSPGQGP
jgi:acyl-CoA synthetase (AMP-forming)/AMP-acid ligase II